MNLDFCLTFNSVSKIPFGREMVKRRGERKYRVRDIVFFPYDPKKNPNLAILNKEKQSV